MNKNTFIGLDQALLNTGWAIIEVKENEVSIKKWGCFTTSSKLNLYDRLINIQNFIKQLVVNENPQLVFTERVFINRAINSSCINLIRVETIIHAILVENEINFKVMSSVARETGSWRRPFSLSSEKKSTVNLFGSRLKNLNEHSADAVGIVLGGLVQHGYVSLEQAQNYSILK